MSGKSTNETLYRKYRPQKFEEVLGQEHITKVLSASIKNKRLSHAYIFAGSRGTGKTSTARILANELGITPTDIYEIDAASNRGIDEIRALKEAVYTLPYESPYKIYILDEAHMLTKEAWNALLKTLEEPPAHVLFVLATTELGKVPETALSRCQTFTFKKPSRTILKELSTEIARKEGFDLPGSSAELIATLAEGSFRDAQGILQKIISFSKDKKIDPEEVETITGAPRGEFLRKIIGALEDGRPEPALEILEEAGKSGTNMQIFAKLLLERLRAVLLLRFVPKLKNRLEEEYAEEDFAQLEKVSKNPRSAINSASLLTFIEAAQMIPHSAIPSLPLELAIIQTLIPEKK